MTFSGHVSVVTITLKIIPDPAMVLIINLLLHPILDAIPHAEWSTFRDSKIKMIAFTTSDLIIGLLVVGLAIKMLSLTPWLIFAALLAGLWLDILDPFARKHLKALRRFHEYLHTWPESPDNPVDWGKTVTGKTKTSVKIIIQSSIIVLALWILNS